MEIIRDVDQLSDEWFELRIGSVGGSSIKDLMAKGQGKSRKSLMYRLVEEIRENKKYEGYVSKAMEEGTRREPESRRDFRFITGLEVEEVGLIKGNVPGTHCSPDGLTSDDAGLELKNPIYTTQLRYIDEDRLPLEYVKQVQYSMWIAEYDYWWFFSYHPKLKPFLLKVERDESLIKTIKIETIKFLAELKLLIKKME